MSETLYLLIPVDGRSCTRSHECVRSRPPVQFGTGVSARRWPGHWRRQIDISATEVSHTDAAKRVAGPASVGRRWLQLERVGIQPRVFDLSAGDKLADCLMYLASKWLSHQTCKRAGSSTTKHFRLGPQVFDQQIWQPLKRTSLVNAFERDSQRLFRRSKDRTLAKFDALSAAKLRYGRNDPRSGLDLERPKELPMAYRLDLSNAHQWCRAPPQPIPVTEHP